MLMPSIYLQQSKKESEIKRTTKTNDFKCSCCWDYFNNSWDSIDGCSYPDDGSG